MNKYFGIFLVALMSIQTKLHAKEITLCGIAFLAPAKGVEFLSKEYSSDLCKIEIKNFYLVPPPIFQDDNFFEVSTSNLGAEVEKFSFFEFHPEIGYRLLKFEEIIEPQYSLKSIEQKNSTFKEEDVIYISGREMVQVNANFSQLWPDKRSRNMAMNLYVGEKGLFMECFYGHVSNKIKTTTLSICLPREIGNNFLNINDIERMFKSIRYSDKKLLN